MLVVFKGKASQFELARAFHIDPIKTVHQNVGDGVVLEQWFKRTKAENLIQNFAAQTLALGETERNCFAVNRIANQDQDLIAGCIAHAASQFFKVKTIENLAVQVGLNLLVLASFESL